MTFNGRTRLLTIGLSAVLAVGALGAGVAMAQDGGAGSSDQGERHDRGHHKILKNTLKSIHEHSGLPAGTFKQGFKDGKSINQVLIENNVDPASVEAAVLLDVEAALDGLVASGEIDAAKADELYAAAAQRLPQLMDRAPDPDREGRKPGARVINGIKGLLGSAAEALGMEPRELGQRMKAGETITEIANAEGVAVETVIEAMLAEANARIDQAEANGSLDAVQADEAKAKIAGRIETFVTEGRQRTR